MITSVLFICHGNVCRSVSAEYILKDLVRKRGLEDEFFIDSAATSTEEIGNPIYPPMRKALEEMKIPIGNHRARQLQRSDYDKYDLLIGMDEENLYYMRKILGSDPDHKLHYLMEFSDRPEEIIDDPWYTRQFHQCALQIQEGCMGLLDCITK
ncbi:MAG: low molecular weight phosphotyrosine protein phosphatase [Lachnospiraceae bacterium]|nr:low molecular weight phosphotyrosine protein phosphatase [Lachnospiraceae bacterium]